jgi:hypothetical protein
VASSAQADPSQSHVLARATSSVEIRNDGRVMGYRLKEARLDLAVGILAKIL